MKWCQRIATVVLLGCGDAGLLAQEPAPPPAQPQPKPAEAPIDAAQRDRARQLLQAHAERSRVVKVLVAQYVQRRTTKLAKEPLESRGEFLFVREPACVVFRATRPRVSVVRLTALTYEVYRPQRKQLERFVLAGPELPQSLFAAVGGDVERLLRDFEVRACVCDPTDATRALVRFVPKDGAVAERLRELTVTLRAADASLCAVAYRDQSGDLVEIELVAPVSNPPSPPSAEFELPADTTIVEHAPPKKTG